MHVSGIARVAASYEHIDPAAVGNERRVLVSELSGPIEHHGPGPPAQHRGTTPKLMDKILAHVVSTGERGLPVRGGRRLVRPAGAASAPGRSGRTSSGSAIT